MANDINSVVLVGRLTRDAVLRRTKNGNSVSNFSIACNENVRLADGTWDEQGHYFDLVMWGQSAENLVPYLVKGRQISVQGRLRQHTWIDQDNGSRSKIIVSVQTIQLLANSKTESTNPTAIPAEPQYEQTEFQARNQSSRKKRLNEYQVTSGNAQYGNNAYQANTQQFDDTIPF